MKLAIMQPYFFPYLGYFQLINAADVFVVYDDVNYINKGWINRNNILVNGKINLITLPLKDANQNKLIKDIELFDDSRNIEKLLKTIEFNYKKAPFFELINPIITDIMTSKLNNISTFNLNAITTICNYLDISSKIVPSSVIYNNAELKAQNRILDICKQENATQYINPIGGIEIYTKELFENTGIELNFIKTNFIEYKQFKNEFIPGLSIIDVLMFNSKEKTREMLVHFKLI
jgi:hypothetical protein